MPESYVDGVDELIGQNKYPNRSEVIRIAIRDLLVDELWGERQTTGGIPLLAQLEQMALQNTSKPNPQT